MVSAVAVQVQRAGLVVVSAPAAGRVVIQSAYLRSASIVKNDLVAAASRRGKVEGHVGSPGNIDAVEFDPSAYSPAAYATCPDVKAAAVVVALP